MARFREIFEKDASPRALCTKKFSNFRENGQFDPWHETLPEQRHVRVILEIYKIEKVAAGSWVHTSLYKD